ncbi:MAG: hypothetical protein HKN68_03180 [Saprospiraceae bacterium]|nr:hypothetical protein [Saprospiraceae bacterium]
MAADLTSAFIILLIGMITVFVILALVTWCGRALIFFVNKLHDREKLKDSKNQVPKKIVAVAAAVIHEITNGKGQIKVIKRK